MSALKGYADLADLSENQRIKIIGHRAAVLREVVGVALETDRKKIDRYRRKLEEAYPGLLEFQESPLLPGTTLLRVTPKPQNVPHN